MKNQSNRLRALTALLFVAGSVIGCVKETTHHGLMKATNHAPIKDQTHPLDMGSGNSIWLANNNHVILQTFDNGNSSTNDTTASAGGVQTIVAGTNIMVNATDPANPIVSASGGSADGGTITTSAPLSGNGSSGNPATATGAALVTAITGYTDVSAVVTGSAAQDLSLSLAGLGTIVGPLECDVYTDSQSGGVTTIQPNGLTANQFNRYWYYASSANGTPSSGGGTTLQIFGAATSKFHSRFQLGYATGRPREFHFQTIDFTDSLALNGDGAWTDTSTGLTSINVHHANAGGQGVGSFITCRDLKKH